MAIHRDFNSITCQQRRAVLYTRIIGYRAGQPMVSLFLVSQDSLPHAEDRQWLQAVSQIADTGIINVERAEYDTR